MRVVDNQIVLFGTGIGIVLITLGISSWLRSNADEFKLVHKRIDRVVKELLRLGNKDNNNSNNINTNNNNNNDNESPIPRWIVELKGDVEFLKVRNKFLEDELESLRKLVHSRQEIKVLPLTPIRSIPSISSIPPIIPSSPSFSNPPHLSRDAWLTAAEELVYCDESERRDKREAIEEAMGNMPSVVALIHELFDKNTEQLNTKEKSSLTIEYGNKLYDMFVQIHGDMSAQ